MLKVLTLSIGAGAIPYLNSFFGRSNGPILLDFVSCNFTENTILECAHNGFGITSAYCDHGDDVGVQCLGQSVGLHLTILNNLLKYHRNESITAMYNR